MIALSATLAALGLAAALGQTTPAAAVTARVGIDQRLDAALPLDVRLRDEAGNEAPLARWLGRRPALLVLVYYRCPMLCTQVLNEALRTLRAMSLTPGRDFEIVTLSIDPREGPALAAAKKREYLARYDRPGAETGWHFLTADAAAIDRVARAVGFRYTYDPVSGQFAHASALVVVTPAGRVSRYFLGLEFPPRDLRLALVEAGEGRIGSAVDHLLLYCLRYDPVSGRYGLAVTRALRLGGLATLALLAGSIALWLRRERRLASLAPAGEEVG